MPFNKQALNSESRMNKNTCPLAIVGMSCLFPKADGLQAYWANIKNGVDAITPIPAGSHWNVADYFNADPKAADQTYAQRGGFLSPVQFNPMDFGIAPKDVEATDTTQLLSLVGAYQALVNAGYAAGSTAGREFDRDRTSVILGVTGALELVIPLGARLGHPHWRRALKDAGVDSETAEDVVQRISDSYVGWQENSFPGLLGNVAAGRIAAMGNGNRETGLQECSRAAMRQLGLRNLKQAGGNPTDARRAWDAWAPLVSLIPLGRWSAGERRALADVILAKGGTSEREYLARFDAHPKLANSLRALTRV